MKTNPNEHNRKQQILLDLINDYKDTKKPIDVDFRALVAEYNSADYYTHLIHPYPAKLLMHIPRFFLENNILSKRGDTILDPFCGSGTVLLEGIIADRISLGVDANPLAVLIAEVKTRYLDVQVIKDNLSKLISNLDQKKKYVPDVLNIDYWFDKDKQLKLGMLLANIKEIENCELQDFFLICFSKTLKKVSYADPRISVPVRLNPDKEHKSEIQINRTKRLLEIIDNYNTIEVFQQITMDNIRRMATLNDNHSKASIIGRDSRNMVDQGCVNKESVQLIITSPPYAGAQKYVRSSSLNLYWLDLLVNEDFSELKEKSIGREQYKKEKYLDLKKIGLKNADDLLNTIWAKNPLRAHIYVQYLIEMKASLQQMYKALKKNGYLVLISGNNTVCSETFYTTEYLKTIAISLGFSIVLELNDTIRSYGLMTKRNKTAGIIASEMIHIFKKE